MTWNFPTWQTRDTGPNAGNERHGMIWETGPGALTSSETREPLTNSYTLLFSFLIRSGWTSSTGAQQYFFSIGASGASLAGMTLFLVKNGGEWKLRHQVSDESATTTRYDYFIGDEDGVSWIQENKWYQVGLAADATSISFAVNGSNTPTSTEIANAPGSLTLDHGSSRWWLHGPSAATGGSNPTAITIQWPSCVMGPFALDDTKLDFSDSTVRDRIWDADGNFKNPGENGSLWFNSTYTTGSGFAPLVYLPTGSAVEDNGSHNMDWGRDAGGTSGRTTPPGGLRKQYE